MFKFSAVSPIWKKHIQKLNDWDLPLNRFYNTNLVDVVSLDDLWVWSNI